MSKLRLPKIPRVVKYYLANEKVATKSLKYKVYSKNLDTGKCTVEILSPIRVMINDKIYRFDNHVMNHIKFAMSFKEVDPSARIKFFQGANCKL